MFLVIENGYKYKLLEDDSMKDSMKVGLKESITIEVTEEMLAKFDGELVHPTYSTVALVYHMELVSRKLLLPHLDENEEGMGAVVSLKHLAPSGLGTQVEITATVTDVTERKVVTKITATNSLGPIGEGEVVQGILAKNLIESKIEQSIRNEILEGAK